MKSFTISRGKEISSSDESNLPDKIIMSLLGEIESRYDYIKQSKAILENDELEDEFQVDPTQGFNGLEKLRDMSRNNYAKLIVSATTDRLGIIGFRTAMTQSESGDSEAAEAFERDDMSAKGVEAMGLACSYRAAYLHVDPKAKRQTVVPPTNGAVIPDPFGEPLASLVLSRDRYRELDLATLYLRDSDPETGEARGPVWKFVASREYKPDIFGRAAEKTAVKVTNYDSEVALKRTMTSNWTWWRDEKLDIDRIPVTTLSNKDGKSEFEDYVDIINRINHMILQRVIIATMQAFRQRAVKGDFPEHDPVTGAKIDYEEMFASGPAQMWTLPAESDIWESSPPSYQEILEAVKEDRKDLASQTYTPMSYFSDSSQNSAEGAALQRENYISKIEDRRSRFAPRWKRHLSIYFEVAGDEERSDVTQLEVIWGPLMIESLTNRTAAYASMVSNDIARTTAMRLALGLTPSEIARAEVEAKVEAMNQILNSAMKGATPLERSSYGQNAQTQAASASNRSIPRPAGGGAK